MVGMNRIRLDANADEVDDQQTPAANGGPEVDGDRLTTAKFAGRALLMGEDLKRVSATLKPVLGGIRSATLTFCESGVIVQGTICGQRIFVPVLAADFSEYAWPGEAAVFMTVTDSRRTLLDAFRHDKKKIPVEVSFEAVGTAPARSLTQAVAYAGDPAGRTVHAMKYELWSSCTAYPVAHPDVSFALTKSQLGKLAALAGKIDKDTLSFALKPEGGFCVGTVGEVVRFEVDGAGMRDYPWSGAGQTVLRLLTKNGKTRVVAREGNDSAYQSAVTDDDTLSPSEAAAASAIKPPPGGKSAAATKSVVGYGSGKPFCVAVEDTSAFRAMLQKIRTGSDGMDLSFYLSSTETPMLRVRLRTPCSPCVFVFCTYDGPSMHDLEAVSAVSGAVGNSAKPGPSSVPPKKRSYGKTKDDNGASAAASAESSGPAEKKPRKQGGNRASSDASTDKKSGKSPSSSPSSSARGDLLHAPSGYGGGSASPNSSSDTNCGVYQRPMTPSYFSKSCRSRSPTPSSTGMSPSNSPRVH